MNKINVYLLLAIVLGFGSNIKTALLAVGIVFFVFLINSIFNNKKLKKLRVPIILLSAFLLDKFMRKSFVETYADIYNYIVVFSVSMIFLDEENIKKNIVLSLQLSGLILVVSLSGFYLERFNSFFQMRYTLIAIYLLFYFVYKLIRGGVSDEANISNTNKLSRD